MIVVTGGAGFIGSNIVRALNERGERDVLVVDDLSDGTKFRNLVDLDIADYVDLEAFERRLAGGERFGERVRAVLHQGACSDTTEWDGRYVMARNYAYSKTVLEWCQSARVPLVYASSASVYGAGSVFAEDPSNESALNVYGYSKLLFDRFLRARLDNLNAPVAGLRYFNVYGPGEDHKGRMASVVLHFHHAVASGRPVQLFEGTDGHGDGEQRRDFVHVDDVSAVNLWLLDHPEVSGVFNVGTGTARTFNDVARAVIAWHGTGEIHYIPFPDDLVGRYQSFTEADVRALRSAGFDASFLDVEAGVARYLDRVAGPERS